MQSRRIKPQFPAILHNLPDRQIGREIMPCEALEILTSDIQHIAKKIQRPLMNFLDIRKILLRDPGSLKTGTMEPSRFSKRTN